MLAKPDAGGQRLDRAPVETPWRPEVHVLDAGGLAQTGAPEPLLQGFVLERAVLGIDEERQALLERQYGQIRVGLLSLDAVSHDFQTHFE